VAEESVSVQQEKIRLVVVDRLVDDIFFFSSRRRHTRFDCDWSSDVCSSDLSWAARDLHDGPPIASRPARSQARAQPSRIWAGGASDVGELGPAALQEAAFGGVDGEGDGAVVGCLGRPGVAGPGQEAGTGGRVGLVLL